MTRDTHYRHQILATPSPCVIHWSFFPYLKGEKKHLNTRNTLRLNDHRREKENRTGEVQPFRERILDYIVLGGNRTRDRALNRQVPPSSKKRDLLGRGKIKRFTIT
jgi:hypothetical protein